MPNLMEKLAARAWKREIGNLSEGQRKKLEDRNILNYDRERRGLNRGTDNILSKYQVEKLTKKDFGNRMMDNAGRMNMYKNIDKNNLKDMGKSLAEGGFAGSVDYSGKNKPGVLLGGDLTRKKLIKTLNIPEKRLNIPEKDRAYVRAITKRHEADEIRAGARNLKNKRLSAEVMGQRVPVTTYSTHISPKVLQQESAHTAVAPRGARRFFDALRTKTGEKIGLKATPGNLSHKYGKSGVFKNFLARKLERLQAGAIKKYIKEVF
jgi:hypothetical protein